MLTVINISLLHTLGIKAHSIFAVATYLNTVTAASVDLLGGVFLAISAANIITGETHQTRQLCYVSKSIPGIYLSEEACEALGCIPASFPTVANCDQASPFSKTPARVAATTAKHLYPGQPACSNTGVVGPHEVREAKPTPHVQCSTPQTICGPNGHPSSYPLPRCNPTPLGGRCLGRARQG